MQEGGRDGHPDGGPSELTLEAFFNNVPRPAAVTADGRELRRCETEREYERCRTGWTSPEVWRR